jgi:hypothetical protein
MKQFYNPLMSNVIQIGDSFIPICKIIRVSVTIRNANDANIAKYGVCVDIEEDNSFCGYYYETIEDARVAVKNIAMEIDAYYSKR